MKWFIITVFFLFFTNNSFANSINLSGIVVEVLDSGENSPVSGKVISIDSELLYSKNTDSDGSFTLFKSDSLALSGQEVKLSISDDDLFILSPLAGKIYLPKDQVSNMVVFVASKKSRFYNAFMQGISGYSIQVLLTYNEGIAIETVRSLKNDGYDGAYYESIMNNGIPNNGYFYKVRVRVNLNQDIVDSYAAMKKVIGVKKEIKRRYKNKFDDSFIVVHTGVREELL